MLSNPSTKERATRFAESVLWRTRGDWQDAQSALFDHEIFGPWLNRFGNDAMSEAQAIITVAEERIAACERTKHQLC